MSANFEPLKTLLTREGYTVVTAFDNKSTRLTLVVLVTALHESEDKIQAISVGADDFVTKPVNPHELRARMRSLVRLKRYTDELDSAESVILSLALVIEARDAYTDGQCQRLAGYATALAIACAAACARCARCDRSFAIITSGWMGAAIRIT